MSQYLRSIHLDLDAIEMERSWVCKEGSQFNVTEINKEGQKQEKSSIHKERKDMQQQQKQEKGESTNEG